MPNSDIPQVRNPKALQHIKAAIGNLIIAGVDFGYADQQQHETITEQVIESLQKLHRQVTK